MSMGSMPAMNMRIMDSMFMEKEREMTFKDREMELNEESLRKRFKPSPPMAPLKKEGQEAATFKALIGCQHSSGFWPQISKSVLNTYSLSGNCMGGLIEIDLELKALQAAGTLTAPIEDVLLTIAALFVLQEKFDDQEDEWALIAKKAKAWLKQVGVAKPDQLLAKVNMDIQ